MHSITRRGLGKAAAGVLAGSAGLSAVAHGQAAPIRIGYSMSMTGGLAGNGRPSLLAHQIWAKDINARGGLLGRPVELVFYDDQSAPAQIPAIYTKLLEVDKVDLVVSGYSTVAIAPALPVVMARGMAFITLFGAGANDSFRYDRLANLSVVGSNMQQTFAKGFFEIAALAEPRPRTIAIAGADADAPQRIMESARFQAKAYNVRVVYDRTYPPGTVDLSPVVRAIKSSRADAVFFATYPLDAVALLRAVNEQGLKASLLGGGMIGPQVTAIKQQLGPLLNNVVCWDIYAPEPTMNFPGMAPFLARYREAAGAEKVDPLGLYAAPMAFSQMQVLEQAVTRVGRIDQGAIGADLHASEFKTVMGDIRFDAVGEWTADRNIYVQYQGIRGNDVAQFERAGTQVVLYPEHLRSGTLRVPFPAA